MSSRSKRLASHAHTKIPHLDHETDHSQPTSHPAIETLTRRRSKTVFKFLDLPAELRLMVYEFHLGSHRKGISFFLIDCIDQEAMDGFGPRGVQRRRPAIGVNLLRT